MLSITVVVSAWNEQAKLARCLASVKWADEIIVIDSSSTDETPQIAKKFTSKVIRRLNNPMLNVNKNFGFTKATGDWILSLDADEEISRELAEEIKQVLQQENSMVGYWMPRKNIIFGKWIKYGLWWPDKQLRLFKKNSGKFPCVHVHEYIKLEGQTGELKSSLTHYNYETISQFIRKMDDLYSVSEVDKLTKSNYQLVWYDAIRFPLSDFLKIYFAQEGYKDGLHGLILAMLQAWYAFIVFAKIWEKQSFKEYDLSTDVINSEMNQAAGEINYWMLTTRIKNSSNFLTNLWLKIKRHYGML